MLFNIALLCEHDKYAFCGILRGSLMDGLGFGTGLAGIGGDVVFQKWLSRE